MRVLFVAALLAVIAGCSSISPQRAAQFRAETIETPQQLSTVVSGTELGRNP